MPCKEWVLWGQKKGLPRMKLNIGSLREMRTTLASREKEGWTDLGIYPCVAKDCVQ